MELTKTYKKNGISFTVKNTTRQVVNLRAILKHFQSEEADDNSDIRWNFVLASAYTTDVRGLDWTPVQATDITSESLEASYQRFMDEVPFELGNLWASMVHDLRKPWADNVEKPDANLTAEEKDNPNS